MWDLLEFSAFSLFMTLTLTVTCSPHLIPFNVMSCHIMSYSVLHQYEKTALINAAHGGHKETVMSLLDRGADINHKDDRVSYCDACMIVLLYFGTFSWYDIWYQSISTTDGLCTYRSISMITILSQTNSLLSSDWWMKEIEIRWNRMFLLVLLSHCLVLHIQIYSIFLLQLLQFIGCSCPVLWMSALFICHW